LFVGGLTKRHYYVSSLVVCRGVTKRHYYVSSLVVCRRSQRDTIMSLVSVSL
jgi:hypothetical protein